MTVCLDCKGTKVYVGLMHTEACARCKGTGEEPIAARVTATEVRAMNDELDSLLHRPRSGSYFNKFLAPRTPWYGNWQTWWNQLIPQPYHVLVPRECYDPSGQRVTRMVPDSWGVPEVSPSSPAPLWVRPSSNPVSPRGTEEYKPLIQGEIVPKPYP